MAVQFLPDNDPDLKLARQVNQCLENNESLATIDQPLIQTLLEYRNVTYTQNSGINADKEAIWDQIENQTKPAVHSPPRILTLKNRMSWAVAASIVIAALVGVFYFNYYQQPTLIAQSESAIKTVHLQDGSTITLRPHSQLYTIEKSDSDERYKLKGEGYFEITHNPNRLFSVATEDGSVSVLGTRFTLSTWGQQMQVYLERGSVRVQTAQRDSSVVLTPGESASVNQQGTISTVETSKTEEFTDWLKKQLVFSNKPAQFVVQELEQEFDVSVQLPTQTARMTISGRLSLETLKTSLDDLGLVLGGTFIKNDKRSYVFEPN